MKLEFKPKIKFELEHLALTKRTETIRESALGSNIVEYSIVSMGFDAQLQIRIESERELNKILALATGDKEAKLSLNGKEFSFFKVIEANVDLEEGGYTWFVTIQAICDFEEPEILVVKEK